MTEKSVWVVRALEVARDGFRAVRICAANPCSGRDGWSKTIVDLPMIRYFGFGYEKRILRAISACQAWCDEENLKELLK
jgi:hypothetical protein